MENTTEHPTPDSIIDAIGGTNVVAKACGVTPGAVSQWRNNGIPLAWSKYLALAYPSAFVPEK